MNLRILGLMGMVAMGAACPAGDDDNDDDAATSIASAATEGDPATSTADSATSTSGADGSSNATTDGSSPGYCADQTTRAACEAHVGTNDIGEPVPDCSWEPTYRVTIEDGTCAFEEQGGDCLGVAFDDTCGVEGDICDDGRSVGYVIDPDGTVRISTVFYASTCGFPSGLQPCSDVGGDPTGGATTGGTDSDPPECACGCEL